MVVQLGSMLFPQLVIPWELESARMLGSAWEFL